MITMKFLLKIFKGPIKRILMKELANKEYQDLVVTVINEKVDIPNLDETEEAKLFDSIYEASREALATALDRL